MIKLPNVSQFREEFQKNHFAIIPNSIDAKIISRWVNISNQLIQAHGIEVNKKVKKRVLSYRVVLGEIIRDHFAELMDFYLNAETLQWMAELVGEKQLFTSPHLPSAININYMDKPVDRYPWHYDVVAYTALLYLTTNPADEGGELEICLDEKNINEAQKIPPIAGTLVVMDGTCCYHSVAPLLKAVPRISIPMVYPTTEDHQRPKEVDDFIYNNE